MAVMTAASPVSLTESVRQVSAQASMKEIAAKLMKQDEGQNTQKRGVAHSFHIFIGKRNKRLSGVSKMFCQTVVKPETKVESSGGEERVKFADEGEKEKGLRQYGQ